MEERKKSIETVYGFWSTTWQHRRTVLQSWDIWFSLSISVFAGILTPKTIIERKLSFIAGTELGVASALLGIILAGLAILVVFLDEDYLAILAQTEHGLQADIFPFWFTGALAVWSISLNLLIILFGNGLVIEIQRVLLAFSVWLFLWTVFAVLNLIAFVAGHAYNRSHQMMLQKDREA